MKSWELLRELFYQACNKNIAAKLGLSRSLIYKWTQPNGGTGSGARNPLDVLALLMRLTDARRIAQWVCEQAGGHFTPNPTAPPVAKELVSAVCEVEQKSFATLQSLVEAKANGHIPPAKMAVIQTRWEEQKAAMESFLQGTFRCGALLLALGGSFTADATPALAAA